MCKGQLNELTFVAPRVTSHGGIGSAPYGPRARAAHVTFVTNICSHYRVRTFEILAQKYDVNFYFYSKGGEWYWLKENGVRNGRFCGEYLKGSERGELHALPALVRKLWGEPSDVYLKCINGRFALPTTYIIARLRRKPFILWTGIWQTLQTRFHKIIFPLTRFVYRHSDAVVVYGDHVKRYLVSQGVEAEKIFVAPHAVENEFYAESVSPDDLSRLRGALNLKDNERLILYVGRLEKEKGVFGLLRAFAKVRSMDAVLLLMGEGSENIGLQHLAKDLGIDSRIRFLGYRHPEDTVAFYAMSYVLVLPSISTPQGKEPWGLVVNESMNQGLPVIATDAVGAAAGGLVRDGLNGFVVPEGNVNALAASLDRILESPVLRMQMSCAAREVILTWNNDRMVAGFNQAIDHVLSEKKPKAAID